MQHQIIVHLQNEPDTLHWLLVSKGERHTVYGGTFEQFEQYLQTEGVTQGNCTLVLPAEKVVNCTVDLPPGQARYIAKALPFALEDKLIQDPSYYHLVPIGKPKSGQLQVLAVDEAWMSGQVERLNSLGLNLIAAFVDAQIISDPEQLVVASFHNRLLIAGENQVVTTEVDWAEITLAKILDEDQDVATQLVVAAGDQSVNILKAQIDSHLNQPCEVVTVEGELLNLLVDRMGTNRAKLTNVLTGPFATQKESSKLTKFIGPALVAGSLGLAVFIGSSLVDARRDQVLADAYLQANETLCKDIFGPQKKCRENLLKREVTNVLNSNSGAVDSGDASLLDSLMDLAELINDDLELHSVKYTGSKKEILAVVHAADFSQLETLKSGLEAKGYQAELSASQDKGRTRGNFKLVKGAAS